MRKAMVDTSVLIDFLRRKDKANSIFYRLVEGGWELSISPLVLSELYSGKSVWRSDLARKELEVLLKGLEVLVLNREICVETGRIRAIYGLDLIDSMVAAMALARGWKLATLNERHFKVIRGLGFVEELIDCKQSG